MEKVLVYRGAGSPSIHSEVAGLIETAKRENCLAVMEFNGQLFLARDETTQEELLTQYSKWPGVKKMLTPKVQQEIRDIFDSVFKSIKYPQFNRPIHLIQLERHHLYLGNFMLSLEENEYVLLKHKFNEANIPFISDFSLACAMYDGFINGDRDFVGLFQFFGGIHLKIFEFEGKIIAHEAIERKEIIEVARGKLVKEEGPSTLKTKSTGIIDVTNTLKYLGHSCKPNAKFVERELIATKKIAAWDEITIDYARSGKYVPPELDEALK